MKMLLVQFDSDLLTQDEDQRAKEYYDKLYSTRRGYHRFGPTWEIPQWIARMKRNFPEADVLFAKSLLEVQSKQRHYTHLAFSALDCNWHLIRTIAQSFSGKVVVGGYCDKENLCDLHNVFWFDSVHSCCNFLDVPYHSGIDYSEFAGRKTIGRLTLSTGCRHRCKFCTVPDDVVKTSTEDVYQQADELCRLNSPLVYLNDKTFGQADNWWLLPQLFGYFARHMVCFDGFIVQTTARQLLRFGDDFLKRSGIRYVELGVESYNSGILEAMQKPSNKTEIDGAVRKLRRLGIHLIPNLIIGLPGESRYSYSNTLAWLERNIDIISHVNIYSLAVYDNVDFADEIEAGPDDLDENVVGKSWHTDKQIHEDFAAEVYAFGMRQLGATKAAKPLLDFTTADCDKEFSQPRQPAAWPATRRGPARPDVWRLYNVPDVAWQQDDSGIACLIRWTATDVVRIDLIDLMNEVGTDGGRFIVSFQGEADNVRRHTMQWLAKYVPEFSLEHAAYIGAEIERADTERIDYVQDGEKPKAWTKTVYGGPGQCKTVPCTGHSYAWSGAMPCTGIYRCVYCGKPAPNHS